jgi:predicted component of type VI protein secretion system
MNRFFLIFLGCVLLAGCASEGPLTTPTNDTRISGEATPPPNLNPRGGWNW